MKPTNDEIRFLPEDEQKEYLTLKEAALLSSYTPDYIGQLIRAGKIEGHQVYTNVSWVTTEKALRRYMESKGKSDMDTELRFFSPGFLQKYGRYTLYLIIGVLILVLLVFSYILFVGIDRAVTESSLKKFDNEKHVF